MKTNFRKIRFKNLVIVVLVLVTNWSVGQNAVSFDRLTTRAGLSQNDVNSIFQDKKGFMWFGTHDGLNRYDGYKFTVFTPDLSDDSSINSNLIWKVIGDKKGDLWIATTGSGVNFFDSSTERFHHFVHDDNDEFSISNNHVSSILIDKGNKLWVATSKGIDMLDLNRPIDEAKFRHINLKKNKIFDAQKGIHINSIFEDSNKQIWVTSVKGIYKLEHRKNGDMYFQYYNQFMGIPTVAVRSIAEDPFGNLVIGTHNHIYLVSKRDFGKQRKAFYWGNFNDIKIDDKYIWCATNGGLLQFKLQGEASKPILINHYKYDPNKIDGISSNSIRSLYIDDTGILWVGTYGAGINKYDPHRKQFQHIQKTATKGSISSNKIRSLFEDSNGYLWFGTEIGGLDVLTAEHDDGAYDKFESLDVYMTAYAITEVNIAGKKKVMIGGVSTPNAYMIDITEPKEVSDFAIEPLKDVTNTVFSILQDKNSNIWIGTYNDGVKRWLVSGSEGEFTKDVLSYNKYQEKSISNNIIRDIYEDSFGNIWFATANGLNMLPRSEVNARSPKFEVFNNVKNDTTSISHDYILTVFESSSNELWVGTLGGGLNKFVPAVNGNKAYFKRYLTENGLPNNVIKGIVEDDEGNLWIATNRGISKFNPRTEKFQNYNVNDGLQSDEFGELSCLVRKSGQFVFGGVNGFNAFFPKDIKSNNLNAETVLTDFSIFNKSIGIGEEVDGRVVLNKSINEIDQIQLRHDENSFSFEFAALHYAASDKNKYSYKLEGFNEKWLQTTSEKRYATYTNLEPGAYVFKVKSSNNDGVWDTTPVQLKINVSPPFWKTNFAKFIYIFFIVALLWAFRRFTIIKTTKKYALEFEHMEKEKKEELNKLKLEFFTNISHEFRTPLTLINGPLEYLLNNGDNISAAEARVQYKLMKKNTGYLLRLVNQLIDFRKMDRGKLALNIIKGDISEFLKEVGEPFQFLGTKKNIDFKVLHTKSNLDTWFDPDAVEKIVNNLLSNAFKFTPEEGTIRLEVMDAIDFKESKDISDGVILNDFILIKVQDSGSGIPTHRINHIFERFYMEVDKLKMNTKGSGIGLSYTKNLVDLHQGVIRVKSSADKGTCFYVWLPKTKNAYKNKEGISIKNENEFVGEVGKLYTEPQAIELIDEITDQSISRRRSKLPVLLVVEDNEDIRLFLKKGLGNQYYIYEAENGERGFEMAKKYAPNIIITDVMMPVMDGVEFCNNIKTSIETSHIPVLMLTAKISQESEMIGLKNGADGYVRKPFDIELVELKLKNILKFRDDLRKKFTREIRLKPTDVAVKPVDVTVTSTDEKFLQKVIDIIEKNMMNTEFSVESLVKEMYLSRSNIYLKVKELTGLTTSALIRNIRLKRAMQLLTDSNMAVKEIMYMTGFSTASYFSKCFKKQYGYIPSDYVKQLKNDTTNLEDLEEENNQQV
ncbi:hybrid sensor histidine kinase/response regulator transcription factor [Wenyingzhuangia sp. IMCC45574]